MPHVKGNKFKPKPDAAAIAAQQQKEAAAAAAAVAAAASPTNVGAVQGGKSKAPKKKTQVAVVPTVLLPAPKGKPSSLAGCTSNWDTLRAAMESRKAGKGGVAGKKRKAHQMASDAGDAGRKKGPSTLNTSTEAVAQLTRVLAVDCEMVGVGRDGDKSALARVSVVNAAGAVVYDSFVSPGENVTDYRTKWSGVRPANLRGAPGADDVRSAVATLLRGRLLVGHAIQNDLDALGITHPSTHVRDTSRYPPLMKKVAGGKAKPCKLRALAQEHLGIDIQGAEHDPVEDARAALSLYQKHKQAWERWVAKGAPSQRHGAGAGAPTSTPGERRGKETGPLGAERLAELARNDYMADL